MLGVEKPALGSCHLLPIGFSLLGRVKPWVIDNRAIREHPAPSGVVFKKVRLWELGLVHICQIDSVRFLKLHISSLG